MLGWLADIGAPVTVFGEKTSTNIPLDLEFIDIPTVLDLPKRKQDVSLKTGPVTVYRYATVRTVVEQDFSIAPGVVLVGDDIILQIADFLTLAEGGFCPGAIVKLKRRFVIERFVDAIICQSINDATPNSR